MVIIFMFFVKFWKRDNFEKFLGQFSAILEIFGGMSCYADAVEEADTQLVDAAYCTALMVITLMHVCPHFIDKIYTYE